MDPRLITALTSRDVDAVCTFCEDAASFRAAADAADDRATELLFGTYAEIAMGQSLSEIAELGSLDDGAFYVDQLTTAARVFSRR